MTPASTAHALTAAVQVGRHLDLPVGDAYVLAEGYSVRVHLAPSPVVARVPTLGAVARAPIRPWLQRELAVTTWLAAQGAPVIAPTAEVDPGPHEHDGLQVTLWTHVTISPEPPAQQDFGAALADLHSTLRAYPGDLPVLIPAGRDIVWSLQRTDSPVAHRAYARLRDAIHHPQGTLQPLHGDAHTGNLAVTAAGLRWNDFEDVCRGPVAWDLASATIDQPAVDAYPDPPSAAQRETYRDVRRLQILTAALACPDWFPEDAVLAAELLTYFTAQE